MEISYPNKVLKKKYVADFICYDSIIIETKALSEINNDHYSQILNYLKATQMEVGLLNTFGGKSLQYKRIATTCYFK